MRSSSLHRLVLCCSCLKRGFVRESEVTTGPSLMCAKLGENLYKFFEDPPYVCREELSASSPFSKSNRSI